MNVMTKANGVLSMDMPCRAQEPKAGRNHVKRTRDEPGQGKLTDRCFLEGEKLTYSRQEQINLFIS